MTTLFLIYAAMACLTVAHSTYLTGKEQARMKQLNPTTFAAVNWGNNFYMVFIWFGYWLAMLGRYTVRNETRFEAADGLGIPRSSLVDK